MQLLTASNWLETEYIVVGIPNIQFLVYRSKPKNFWSGIVFYKLHSLNNTQAKTAPLTEPQRSRYSIAFIEFQLVPHLYKQICSGIMQSSYNSLKYWFYDDLGKWGRKSLETKHNRIAPRVRRAETENCFPHSIWHHAQQVLGLLHMIINP